MERVLRDVLDAFAARYRSDRLFAERFRGGDERVFDELVDRACKKHGVVKDDYVTALDSDADLSELQRQGMTKILLGPVERSADSKRKGNP